MTTEKTSRSDEGYSGWCETERCENRVQGPSGKRHCWEHGKHERNNAYVDSQGHTIHLDQAARRKAQPVFSGVLAYFPDAILAVSELSRIGNEQHNPGQPLHWARDKSTDEPDALVRHLLERGTRDEDGVRHSAKVAWRALANLQRELEAAGEAEISARLGAGGTK